MLYVARSWPTSPAACHVVPDVSFLRSRRTTSFQPRSVRWKATLAPTMPPPMTTTRAWVGKGVPAAPGAVAGCPSCIAVGSSCVPGARWGDAGARIITSQYYELIGGSSRRLRWPEQPLRGIDQQGAHPLGVDAGSTERDAHGRTVAEDDAQVDDVLHRQHRVEDPRRHACLDRCAERRAPCVVEPVEFGAEHVVTGHGAELDPDPAAPQGGLGKGGGEEGDQPGPGVALLRVGRHGIGPVAEASLCGPVEQVLDQAVARVEVVLHGADGHARCLRHIAEAAALHAVADQE